QQRDGQQGGGRWLGNSASSGSRSGIAELSRPDIQIRPVDDAIVVAVALAAAAEIALPQQEVGAIDDAVVIEVAVSYWNRRQHVDRERRDAGVAEGVWTRHRAENERIAFLGSNNVEKVHVDESILERPGQNAGAQRRANGRRPVELLQEHLLRCEV